MKTQARDMTEGSIAKNIILFYIPLAIGGLFQQLYSFVDSVVVGRGIGAQALAAVGATSIVVWLTLGFAMGLTMRILHPYFTGPNGKRIIIW